MSPLLANIVLDELDKELERRGHRFCRYADDCNIYVKSQKAGERVMESIKRFITQKLQLKVNETKSKVAKSVECTFLGYTIGSGGKLWIAKKSKERMKKRIKELTRRNRGRKLEAVIGELNRTLGGWLVYFSSGGCNRRTEQDAWRMAGLFQTCQREELVQRNRTMATQSSHEYYTSNGSDFI